MRARRRSLRPLIAATLLLLASLPGVPPVQAATVVVTLSLNNGAPQGGALASGTVGLSEARAND